MMPQNKAATIPENPWFDGNADVILLPGDVIKTIPLKNVGPGETIVNKNEYPDGLVLIPPTPPTGNYAVLPIEYSNKESEIVDVGSSSNPNGVVVLFRK